MAANTSSPATAFTKVLRSFETGGFTDRDVVDELKRLLKTGASPVELSEILRRREFVEPLPIDARKEVLGVLDAAKKRAAAEAIDQDSPRVAAVPVSTLKPVAVPDESSAAQPATVRMATPAPSAVRTEGVAKTAIRMAPPPRIPDPVPTPESKLTTVPVEVPAARATRTSKSAPGASSAVAAPKGMAADGPGNVVARAITLARTSPSPVRSPASPDSVQRRARPAARIASPSPRPSPSPSPSSRPSADAAPASVPSPPAEPPVTEGGSVPPELHEPDDWSDLVISREELTPDPIAEAIARRRRGISLRGSVRAIGWSAAALILAALAWFYAHRAPPPAKAVVAPAAATAPGSLIRDCPTCAAMIVLPAAGFKQGFSAMAPGSSSYEKPQHWVDIKRSFAMAENLVTVEEYGQFIAATGRATQGCETYSGSWKYRLENNWQNPGFAQSGLHPVTCVSWNDAVAYAQWLSAKTGHRYRLPSASEWEYAALAGGERVYPWASNGANACAFANVADASAARRYPGWAAFPCDDGYANTSPVGSFKANPFGLNDMLGNVFQWTLDCWHADYHGAPVDGSARADGDCSERELRGGSWFTSPSYVRVNYRNHFAADYRASSVGIRLVRDTGP